MEPGFIHIATAGLSTAVNSLDPIFDDLFIPFGDKDCNVDFKFFQRRRLIDGRSPKKKM